jgi:hypothetical protein
LCHCSTISDCSQASAADAESGAVHRLCYSDVVETHNPDSIQDINGLFLTMSFQHLSQVCCSDVWIKVRELDWASCALPINSFGGTKVSSFIPSRSAVNIFIFSDLFARGFSFQSLSLSISPVAFYPSFS